MDASLLAGFEALYADVAGYKLSHRDRNERPQAERSFVYGEVLPHSFEALVSVAAPKPGERFVDLGCGVGKAVLLAALQFPFGSLTGVELLPSLVGACRDALQGFDRTLRPALPADRQAVEISFVEQDLRHYSLYEADVVFVHASCFERALMEPLNAKATDELRPGARVVVVGRYLSTPALALLKAQSCEMDWGEASACVYQRR
jgi:SAM-dependent methyltransferase